MKKTLLTFIILVSIINIYSCKKDDNKEFDNENGLNIKTFVNSQMGLVLRAGPDVSTEALANVPYKEKVIIIKYSDADSTIDSIKAPWAYVKFKHLKGWLFCGYLKGELRSGNFKNHDLGKLIQTVSAAYKVNFQGQIFNTPEQITIEQIEGDLCVVGYTAIGRIEDEAKEFTAGSVALWQYKNGTWHDFNLRKKQMFTNFPGGMNIQLLYLNPDEFVDVYSSTGLVMYMSMYIYLYDGNDLKLIEDFDTSFESELEHDATCSSKIIRIDDHNNKGDKIVMKFNCRSGKYDVIKKE